MNLMDLAVTVRTDGTAQVSRDLKGLEKQASTTSKNTSSSLKSIGSSMKSVGTTLSLAVTAPLALAGAAAVKMGAQYEQSLQNAVSVTGATGKAADELKGKMNDLALQLGAKTAFSAKDAADAMYDLASSGWSVKQMQQGLSGIMALAAATQSDLAFATETVTSAISQYGMKASDSGKVSDIFTAAINESRLKMDGLSEAMSYVGPVAAGVGMSLEETTAIIAKMADAGIDGSTAGTSLRAAIASLSNPVGQTKKALADMGVAMSDVNPATHSMSEILKTLKDAGMDTNDAMRLFGREGGPAMLAVAEQGVPKLNKLTDALKNSGGTAERTAKEQLDTLAGKWEELTGSLETAAITYYQKVEPFLKAAVAWLTPLVNKFTELSPGVQTAILVFAAFAAAIGPALFVLGPIVTALGALAGVFGGGVLVAGVAAFTAAILGLSQIDFGDALERAKTFAKNLQEALKPPSVNDARLGGKAEQGGASGFIAGMIQSVQAAIPKVKAAFGAVSDVIRSTVGSVVDWLKQAFATLWPYIEPAINNFIQGFKALQPAIAPLVAFLSGVLKGVFMAIVPIIGTVLVVALNVAALAFRGIAEVVGWVGQKLTPFIPIIKTVGTVIGYVLGTLIGSSVSLAIKVLSKFFPVLAKLGPFFTRILASGRSSFTALGNIFRTLWARATAIFQTGQKVVTGVFKVIGIAARAVGSVISKAWNAVSRTTSTVFNAIAKFLTRIWNGIKSVAAKVLNWYITRIKQAWENIKSATTAAWNFIRDAIGSKITTAYNKAKEIASKLWSAIKSVWQSVKDGTAAAWSAIASSIWNPISDAYDKVVEWINRIIGVVNDVLKIVGLPALKVIAGGSTGSDPGGGATRKAGVMAFARGGRTGGAGPHYVSDDTLVNYGEDLRTGEREYFIPTGRRHHRTASKYWAMAGQDLGLIRPGGERPGRFMDVRGFAAGGMFTPEQVQKTVAWAHGSDGQPYAWGGSWPPTTDCSGWQNVVFQHISGNSSPSGRMPFGSTATMTDSNMAALGFKKGVTANPGYNVGVAYSGPGGGHTAGTLAWGSGEINTETGGGAGGTMTGGSAWGAKNSYFSNIYGLGSPGDISGAGGGMSVPNPMQILFEQLWKRLVKPVVDSFLDPLEAANYVMLNAVGAAARKVPKGIYEWIDKKIPDTIGGGGGSPNNTLGGDAATNRKLGEDMLKGSGVAGSFSALDSLWTKESGWDRFAKNASSGAYGIPQALPESKLPPEGQQAGGSKAGPQIGWGLDYISGRYGSTDAAWQHSQQYGWYSDGGMALKPHVGVFGEAGREFMLPIDNGRAMQAFRASVGFSGIEERLERVEDAIRHNKVVELGAETVMRQIEVAREGTFTAMKSSRGQSIQNEARQTITRRNRMSGAPSGAPSGVSG